MVFMLTPLCSASVVFTNSLIGKAYMTARWRGNPDGAPGNPVYENDHKAQLNEAEWSPLLIAGLLCLHAKGDKVPTIAAGLCAFGSIWYLWSRILLVAKAEPGPVLPGGVARYIGGFMVAFQLMKSLKNGSMCPVH